MTKYHELVKHYVDNASHEDMVELTKETDGLATTLDNAISFSSSFIFSIPP